MATEYLALDCKGVLSDFYSKMATMFPNIQADSDEGYALSAIMPTPEELVPGQVPFNSVTTVRELTKDKDGKFLIELGEDPRMEKLKAKMRKTALTGVEKLTLEQARARLPVGLTDSDSDAKEVK
jgi:hypothetical protein